MRTIKTMQVNVKFHVGQTVVCTLGLNKGKKFVIQSIIKNGYSCKLADGSNDKYYSYNDNTLELSL